MRIIGIDPGYAIIGFGVLEYRGGMDFAVVGFGAITTPADKPFNDRLKMIYDDMAQVLDTYKPDQMGIEKLYFNTNETTAISVAQARGVTLHTYKRVYAAASKIVNNRLWQSREKAGAGNDKADTTPIRSA